MKYYDDNLKIKEDVTPSKLNTTEYMDFIRESRLVKLESSDIDEETKYMIKSKIAEMSIERSTYSKNKQKIKINSIVNTFIENDNADNRFYYFRFLFKNKIFYKIGITSQTLKDRYGKDFNKIDKVLYDKKIDGAIKIERELKEKFSGDIFSIQYLNGGGHTETFDRDILELDL